MDCQIPAMCVSFKSNLVNALLHSWWPNGGATVNVAITLQWFKNRLKPSEGEAQLRVGNAAEVEVKFIWTVSLNLKSDL